MFSCVVPLLGFDLVASVLHMLVKPMYPGRVAVGDQIRLGRQPMLHFVSGSRTLVDIAEVSFPCHLVRRRDKVTFVPTG